MPVLNLKVSGQSDQLLAEQLVEGLTGLTQKHLKKKPEVTAITLQFIADDSWFVKTKSLQSLGKKSFYLDIKVTDSTNLKDEKADYIQAVFEFMEDTLGNLHTESYVYVEEVKGDAYGFGGVTQERRYIDGKHHSR